MKHYFKAVFRCYRLTQDYAGSLEVSTIEQAITQAFTHHQCMAKKGSNTALLARVTRLMA
jgi:hypothetical protein